MGGQKSHAHDIYNTQFAPLEPGRLRSQNHDAFETKSAVKPFYLLMGNWFRLLLLGA